MKSSVVCGENRGSVNEILLKALQSGDKYGYEIKKEIVIKSDGQYFLKEPSLYSGLKRLESAGYITSYWKDGELGIKRHYYSITEKGVEKLNNSNFTWDSSKNFLEDMFNSKVEENLSKKEETPIKIDENPTKTEKNIAKNDEIIADSEKKIENGIEVGKSLASSPKNPFQIEVNPLQQSIFDFAFSSEIKKEQVPLNLDSLTDAGDTASEKSQVLVQEKAQKQEEKPQEQVQSLGDKTEENSKELKTQGQVEEKQIVVEKQVEEKEKIGDIGNKNQVISQENGYEELIKNFSSTGYADSLDKAKKTDISALLKKDEAKINESNIVLNKEKTSLGSFLNRYSQNLKQEDAKNEIVEENKTLFNLKENLDIKEDDVEKIRANSPLIGDKNADNFVLQDDKITNNTNSSVDIKNIFGSLLVSSEDDNQSKNIGEIETNFSENVAINEQDEDKNLAPKEELPRINVDDDVNITLDAHKKNYYYEKKEDTFDYQDKIVTNQNSNNVKKYIDNVRKSSLLPRPNVDEEIDLSGIAVREYERMNNKLIKNSNYIYSNKLNFFLCLFVSIFAIIESISSFVVFALTKNLHVFEILFLSASIVAGLGLTYYFGLIYYKDRYKTQLKSSYRNTISYLILIFVVSLILVVCMNIFEGMNENNTSYFVVKICLEALILLNIPLFGILKKVFYKLKFFSN